MRTIIWFFYFWMYQLVLLPARLRLEKLRENGQPYRAQTHQIVRKWARRLLACAGAKVTVTGAENLPDEAVVFVGNHTGNFDIPLVLAYLGDYPCGIVAKQQLEKLPLIRQWMYLLGCVFLDRDDARKAMTALQQATAQVKDGQNMLIFPEGTRSRTGMLGEFKSGAFRVAQKSGATIVPLCIRGTENMMERNGNWIRPAKLELHILPAIDTADFTKEDWRDLPQRTQALLAQALLDYPNPN